MELETIKSRIRKLMAVAGDGMATDGEIDNALRLAAKLMDAHHLSDTDVTSPAPEAAVTFGQATAVSTAAQFSTWESSLACAVSELIGSVKHYQSGTAPIRVNGVALLDRQGNVRQGRQIVFYGPALEAAEAKELFEEWARSIAAMGVARWGGCYRGDGAMYCYGFAARLCEKARQINGERRLTTARAPAIAGAVGQAGTAITLSDRYELLKDGASAWLRRECNVHLSSASRRSGYSAGSSSALAEGRAHGDRAGFGRATKRMMLPG